MLLGKRPHHRIRRTTSVTSITVVDLDVDGPQEEPQPEEYAATSSLNQAPGKGGLPRAAAAPDHRGGVESIDMDRQSSFLALVSPRNYGGMEAESAHFLTTCGLCKSRLFPGRDIYMYRHNLL